MPGLSLISRLSGALGGPKAPAAATVLHESVMLPDEGQVLYVVGDVHGCLSQLKELERRIVAQAQRMPDREHILLVAGDMIDRGPQSAEVIDHVSGPPGGGIRRMAIVGNHEAAMLDALDSASAAAEWLQYGGHETLISYGASHVPRLASRSDYQQLRRMMEFLVPEEHWDWLRRLPRAVSWRNYFVTHAGVRPGTDLADQSLRDLTSIREPFLSSREDFGAVVVHGHTPSAEPERYSNRIGIDTGCYLSGRLSAVMLDGDSVRFLTVS